VVLQPGGNGAVCPGALVAMAAVTLAMEAVVPSTGAQQQRGEAAQRLGFGGQPRCLGGQNLHGLGWHPGIIGSLQQ
jgi:hypothetical protein